MNLRALYPRDIEQVKAIHKKFYEKEFNFTEFERRYLGSFVVLEDEQVILAGGVRSVAEVVIVTDKDCSVRMRKDALIMAHDASKHIAKHTGHDLLHAYIQDENWLKQLLKYGFRRPTGQAVILDV